MHKILRGPWELRQGFLIYANDSQIAAVWAGLPGQPAGDAVAQAIIALPALLAFAQSVEDEFGEVFDSDGPMNGGDAVDAICSLMAPLRAALALAKGEAVQPSGAKAPLDPWCQCANCLHSCPQSELNALRDVAERVLPGETMPAGECPVCGACAHLAEGGG